MVHAALADALRDAEARAYVLTTAGDYSPGSFGWWAQLCGLRGDVLAERLRQPDRLEGITEAGVSNSLRR